MPQRPTAVNPYFIFFSFFILNDFMVIHAVEFENCEKVRQAATRRDKPQCFKGFSHIAPAPCAA